MTQQNDEALKLEEKTLEAEIVDLEAKLGRHSARLTAIKNARHDLRDISPDEFKKRWVETLKRLRKEREDALPNSSHFDVLSGKIQMLEENIFELRKLTSHTSNKENDK